MSTDTVAPTAVTETPRADVVALAERIGVEVAGPAADAVDREGRFPHESLAAMKEARLLGALVPVENGGLGASLAEVSAAVQVLSHYCASTALMLAMHTIEVVGLIRYGTTPALRALLDEVGTGQVLIANANSEVGLGGDVSRSLCALEDDGDGGLVVDKQVLALSFGAHADAIVSIARRSAEATETDQVLFFARSENIELTETSPWDTMGLRGTGSAGYRFVAHVTDDLIYPVSFAAIASDGVFQARQLLLSAVWLGLAEAAVGRAHAYVRAQARKAIGTVPNGAVVVAQLAADLDAGRSLMRSANRNWAESDARGEGEDVGLLFELRNIKVTTSQLAVATATTALTVCGMEGFRRGSKFSLDRILRDAHGGLVMVSNDRMLRVNAQLLLARKAI